jgi:hypothetical protein
MIPTTNTNTTAHVPNTSLLSDSEKFAPVAADKLDKAVQGAHHAIDRLADSAVPTARHLAQTGDAWTASLRSTVREQPLMAVAAAFALGALLARVTR